MRAVLYTEDMFPITVVDVPEWWWKQFKEHGRIMVAVTDPETAYRASDPNDELQWIKVHHTRYVDIRVEVLIKNGERHMMLFTRSEDEALLLEAAFLPGQLRKFSKGFCSGITY